jgi:hypothetical protein
VLHMSLRLSTVVHQKRRLFGRLEWRLLAFVQLRIWRSCNCLWLDWRSHVAFICRFPLQRFVGRFLVISNRMVKFGNLKEVLLLYIMQDMPHPYQDARRQHQMMSRTRVAHHSQNRNPTVSTSAFSPHRSDSQFLKALLYNTYSHNRSQPLSHSGVSFCDGRPKSDRLAEFRLFTIVIEASPTSFSFSIWIKNDSALSRQMI